MNTTKIAALYAHPIFNTLLRFPDFDPTTTLTQQVMEHVLREAREVSKSEDGRHYEATASNPSRRERYTYKDDVGGRASGFLEESITKRAADWMLNQMPGWPTEAVTRKHQDLADYDVFLVTVMGYGRHAENPEQDIETRAGYYFGAEEDLGILMRGLASIRRKRRKQAKKLEAQLRSYHQEQLGLALAKQQELLRKGHWFGAEKALTTAARVNELGLPFMGEVDLTPEQRKGLHYWAVPADAGMSTHFPAGTGVALKVITSGKQLIDGAVYLSQVTLGRPNESRPQDHIMRLGRLDLSKKTYGMIPLFKDDAPGKDLHIQAEWKEPKEGQGYEVLLMQVTHYTTHNGAPAMQAETQPAKQQPAQRQRKRRELAHAA